MTAAPALPVDAPGTVRLARNAVFSLLRGVVTAPLALIAAAILLARLGPGAVGVYGMLGVLVNPIVTMDFGLTWALTRQVAAARGDRDAIARLIASALAAYLAIVLVLALLYLAGRTQLIGWLAAQSGFAPDLVAPSLDLACATYAVLLSGMAHAGALNGLERIPDNLRATTAHQIALTLAIALFVHGPRGLPALFGATLAASLIQVLIQGLALHRALDLPLAALTRVSGPDARALLSEGTLLCGLAGFRVGFLYLDKWVLAGAVGTAIVGYYELGARLGVVARAVLNTMCTPLLSSTATAASSALADAKLARLSFYSLRYLIAVSVPALALAATQAAALCRLWIGAAPPEAVLAITVLVPSYVLNAWAWSILYQLVGEGEAAHAVVAGGAAVLLNLALDAAALGTGLGFAGVLAANLASSVFLITLLVAGQLWRGRLEARRAVGTILRLALCGVVAGALAALLPHGVGSTRWELALDLGVRLGLCASVYAGLLWLVGEVDDQDRFFLRSLGGLK